jgi:hypothetical protein
MSRWAQAGPLVLLEAVLQLQATAASLPLARSLHWGVVAAEERIAEEVLIQAWVKRGRTVAALEVISWVLAW